MSDIKTNITINVVEPGSSTPVVPNTSTIESISTPDTGLFTSDIGAKEATIIGIVAFIALAAIISIIIHHHNKKHSKITKLTRLLAKYRNTVRSKKKLSIPLASLALVVSLGTFASLIKAGVNAEEVDNTEAQDNASLTLDISSPDLTIEVADEPVFAILPVELTVEEATRAGYTLSAYADNTDIVSTTNPNNIIPMVTVDSEEDLVSLTDNTYGLSLSEPEDKDSEVYTTLSTDQDNPTILKTIDDYSSTEAEDKTTIYYGFYITPDVPKGTYEGSSIYYEAEPNYITTLSFNGHDNDGGEDMEDITIPAGNTITLPDNTYTKDGYHFTGWNTQADGEGEPYAAGAEFTATQGETKDIILYAQWEEELPAIGDLTYMQDFATLSEAGKASVLVSMVQDQQYQLKDSRDQTMYYIAKLADGNIWMTQNLDLDLSAEKTLTPADTNISANWTPNSSTISFTGTTVPGWQDDYNIPYSADPGDVYYYTSNTNDNDIQYNSLTECEAAGYTDCIHYHAGNYYNWSAAVASNDTSSMTEAYGNAPDSICPAGWRLPKARSAESWTKGNEASNLLSSYDWLVGDEYILTYYSEVGYGYYYQSGGFVAIRSNPLWLVRAGSIGGDGSLFRGGEWSEYASSTIINDFASFTELEIGYEQNAVLAINMLYRYRSSGYSIRCIAE